MKDKKRKKPSGRKESLAPQNIIVGIWVMLTLTIFPLYYRNDYYDILSAKFYFYCVITGIMIGLVIGYQLISGNVVSWIRSSIESISSDGFVAWVKKTYSIADICIIVFILSATISTLIAGVDAPLAQINETKSVILGQGEDMMLSASDMIYCAFTGKEGRYTGLMLLLFYFLAYMCVTRCFRFSKKYAWCFLVFGALVCIFGITDHLGYDVLSMRGEVFERNNPQALHSFVSTIGNINTYTTFVGFCLVLSGTLFVMSRERARVVAFYVVTLAIAFMAMAMGSSDNGYLTLAAFFGLLPLVAFRTWTGIRRYVVALAMFFTDIKLVTIIDEIYGDKAWGIDGLFNNISQSQFLMPIIIVLWILAIILYVPTIKKLARKEASTIETSDRAPRAILIAWAALMVVGIVAAIVFIIYANTNTSDARYGWLGSLKYYFVFNDAWGTYRGYVWKAGMEMFSGLPIIHQIFGTGPDTFGLYMLTRYYEMVDTTSQIYDSAHNEYLQYLFTIGIAGLVSYLGLLISTVYGAFKKARRIEEGDTKFEPTAAAFVIACAYLVMCYACQATVNINLPISTPILWTFIMIVGSMVRRKDS